MTIRCLAGATILWVALPAGQEQLLDVHMISGQSFWRGNVGVALRW